MFVMEECKTSLSLRLGCERQAGVSCVREGPLEFVLRKLRKMRKISCAWGAQGTEDSCYTRMNSAVEIPIMTSGFNR